MDQGDAAGGSQALAVVLDDYCEEVWLDLKEFHHGFDLAKWLAGEERATAAMVVAMVNDLPNHSRFKARTYGLGPEPEPLTEAEKKRIDWYQERRFWSDDRMMWAGISNGLQELLVHVPSWKKKPELKPSGPPEWRKITPWTKPPEATVSDVYAVFGFGMTAPAPQAPPAPTVGQAMAVFGYRA